jgi:hypothetical protein
MNLNYLPSLFVTPSYVRDSPLAETQASVQLFVDAGSSPGNLSIT